MVSLQISKSSRRKTSLFKSPLFWGMVILIVIGLIVMIILLVKNATNNNGGGKHGPIPPSDVTDCLALNYYGGDAGAPQKICGVFDGFSHWTWAGMQQWLAYYAWRSGLNDKAKAKGLDSHVVIYEAQFIPESWLSEVKVGILGAKKGIKTPAEALPLLCKKDNDCQQGKTSGSIRPPGPNFTCQHGICVDQCLVAEPKSCKGKTNNFCANYFKNTLNCPSDGFCREDNHTCKYNSPHPDDAGCYKCKFGQKDDPCEKKCTGAWCRSNGCCHGVKADGSCIGNSTEFYQDSTQQSWSAFNKEKCTSENMNACNSFANIYTVVGTEWEINDTYPNGHLLGAKGGEGQALCPYGSYYDPTDKTEGPYGSCKEWSRQCLNGETSMMGFCDKKFDSTTKPATKSVNVYVGKNVAGASSNGFMKLPIPEITLTWYAFVGEVQTSSNDTLAKNYVQTILNFCQAAGIQHLAFPFIIPDKNNTPWITQGTGSAPENAADWIINHVLIPAKNANVGIGLNVYASYKDSGWKNWMTGGTGVVNCFTDNCSATTQQNAMLCQVAYGEMKKKPVFLIHVLTKQKPIAAIWITVIGTRKRKNANILKLQKILQQKELTVRLRLSLVI